jgi:poly(3-hydroxybutyrate) depolymerase
MCQRVTVHIDYGIDDVQFTSNFLDSLQRTFCVDPERIYATGFSNGGGMTGFLACRLFGRITAFAPISGNFYNPPGGCNPERPVAILSFHGTAGPITFYNVLPVVGERWSNCRGNVGVVHSAGGEVQSTTRWETFVKFSSCSSGL